MFCYIQEEKEVSDAKKELERVEEETLRILKLTNKNTECIIMEKVIVVDCHFAIPNPLTNQRYWMALSFAKLSRPMRCFSALEQLASLSSRNNSFLIPFFLKRYTCMV